MRRTSRVLQHPASSGCPARAVTKAVLGTLIGLGLGLALPPGRAAAGAESRSVADLLATARAGAEREQYGPALRAYEEILAGQPELRDSLGPEIARSLTWAGRYEDALTEYRRLLEKTPQRTDLWLMRALAEAWSGHPPEALRAYRQVLTMDPQNRDAQLGEARMLSWSGRLDDAARAYRARLGRDPQDGEAWLGLAQALAWRGENLQARAIGQALVDEGPMPPDWLVPPVGLAEAGADGASATAVRVPREQIPAGTWEVLALACRWSGRDDLALATLEAAERSGRGTPAARRLAQDLEARWVPQLSAILDLSLDSDHFSMRTLRTEGEIPVRHRGHVRWGGFTTRYDRPASPPEDDRWLFAAADGRLRESWHGSAEIRAQVGRPDGADYAPVETFLTAIWTAWDRLRVDLNASRGAIFTYEVFPDRIVARQAGAGITWRLPLPPSLFCSADYTDYSDDNERRQARAGLRWLARARRPRLEFEAGTSFQDAGRWTGHGYWCPDRNRTHSVRAGVEFPVILGIGLFGGIENGIGREAHSDWTNFTAYHAGISGQHGPFRVEGRFGHAGPSERVREGYRRDTGSVAFRYSF